MSTRDVTELRVPHFVYNQGGFNYDYVWCVCAH